MTKLKSLEQLTQDELKLTLEQERAQHERRITEFNQEIAFLKTTHDQLLEEVHLLSISRWWQLRRILRFEPLGFRKIARITQLSMSLLKSSLLHRRAKKKKKKIILEILCPK